ncbi:flavin-containing monooxygenase [Saccharopolyspora flava]|uniref:Predicted flavoprotein CzcO associated with the cation diffusion facilitator CzcD n=1 Tax=Saccharopolyspora flava TaxID=95161 RepID=A0A1I6UFP2_9PSEU|nr:NAD(P)/FAD-dependent oxidoreductase [Saccharopolyspora flava]SFT00250.1 Predicted flavoprotein CzcO associated with the cation diffusion facilitator CzcD [Saccharopolyspora flava]
MTTSVIPGDRSTRAVNAVHDADPERLTAAIDAVSPGPLLMTLVHMTGDRSLLDEFASRLKKARAAEAASAPGEYPAEVAEEVRRRAHAVLSPELVPELHVPDDELFLEMSRVATDDDIGPEYVPYLREQAGFPPLPASEPEHRPAPEGFRVAVVGAGMVGINAAVGLAEAGIGFRVFEASDDIGGTWSRNTYPGAAVDTPSHFYSYSFELNPDWSKFYPTGPEYLAYLRHVADKYGVRDHVELRTRVLGCEWDEQRLLWHVRVQSPGGSTEVYEAKAVITATGILNAASIPEIAGAETFEGVAMHTAEWDDSVELDGKRVVVLGTGCTAVQVVADLAGRAEHLDVVFRQPHWITPERNVVSGVDEDVRWALRHIPYFHQWYRLVTHWFTADKSFQIPRIDPDWNAEHVSCSPANDALMQICLKHLHEELGDRPDLVEMLTPDFPPFAKRIVKDPGFLAAARREDVALHRTTFDSIEPNGVRLANGEFLEADVIIWATGFKLEYLNFLDVVGRDGVTLAEKWDHSRDPRAYLGITVPGFPNFFVTAGPNSAPNHGGGHNVTSEEHVHYAVETLRFLIDRGHSAAEPTVEATDAYNARVDAELDRTVWQHPGTANGYYRNAAGRAWVSCPWRLVDYWTMLRAPNPEDLLLHP